MPVANNGSVRVRYDVHGSGPPILLIMGYKASSALWGREFLAQLSCHFEVITFDNRGTGNSDKPHGAHTIAMMADDAASVLEELQISQAHVFGVSMGGMIAQEFALHYPQQLDRLILGCTTCGGHLATPASWAVRAQLFTPHNVTPEEAVRRQWKLMFSPGFMDARPDIIDRLTESVLAIPTPPHSAMHQALAIQWFDASQRLGLLTTPTLVLTGSADVVIPPANSYLLADRIPDSTLEVVPNAGHGFFWEHPDLLAELLFEFCSAETTV